MKQRMEETAENFAVRVVRMCKYLKEQGKHDNICNQIYRSGTSIAANVNEARHAQSTADFISKMSIALKEADETHYWLKMMKEAELITERQTESMTADVKELIYKLAAVVRTTKRNNGLL